MTKLERGLPKIEESRCPECMGELLLYTKPDGEYVGCSNCDYSIKSNMVRK